jgi:putative tricarboxylic transport membrane protein
MALLTSPTKTVDTTAERRRDPVGRRLLGAAPELAGLVVCVVLLAQTGGLETSAGGPGPAFFPRVVLVLLALSLGCVLAQHLRAPEAAAEPAESTAGTAGTGEAPLPVHWPRFALGVALSVGYVVGTYQLGFPLATALFVVAFVYLAGHRNLLVSVPVALALSVGLTYVFVAVVYVSLPTGVGVFDLLTDHLLVLLGIY